jgi:hypothetical protein
VNGDEVKMATWSPRLGGLELPDALARRAQQHVAEVLGQAATTFSKKVSPTRPAQPYDTACYSVWSQCRSIMKSADSRSKFDMRLPASRAKRQRNCTLLKPLSPFLSSDRAVKTQVEMVLLVLRRTRWRSARRTTAGTRSSGRLDRSEARE